MSNVGSAGQGGGGSPGGNVDSSIQQFQKAQEEATAKSLQVSTKMTEINGNANSIKKISPG
ncbi:hypothetical protein ASG54_08510 [Aureimonas sp. Leaf460]|nr:hypothetical protein ASG62_24195 [Aureimonas sp. Leaf427]KQT79596.1 hypothetical protein ASG54_08510 [Aureimonas sp. Leaf460]